MINPFAEINWRPSRAELRCFGKALFVGGLALALVFTLPWLRSEAGHVTVMQHGFGCVAALGVLIMLAPGWAYPVYVVWHALSACIGIVVANVLMAAFYYLFFTPIALVLRLTGHDALHVRTPPKQSNWCEHGKPHSPARYYKQY